MKPKEIPIKGKDYFGWLYEDQTKIKHRVLKEYAVIWISKLGAYRNTIFFDCHGGCGAYIDTDGFVYYGSSILVKRVADDIISKFGRTTKVGIYVCEKNRNNYDNYCKVLEDQGLKITTFNNDFNEIVDRPSVIKYYNSYPTLFFVDPFGYDLKMSNIGKMMQHSKNELIINFMFDFINRFISEPKKDDHRDEFFGTHEWIGAANLTGKAREEFLINIYKNQLKKVTGAKFVYAYRLCYPDRDQTYYYLIHATNHIDGITYMKNSFARVNNGRVEYLGKKQDAISFFDLDYFKSTEFSSYLLEIYHNRKITVKALWEEIVEDVAFTTKDLSNTLAQMVEAKQITVQRISSQRGSYKEDDVITFGGYYGNNTQIKFDI